MFAIMGRATIDPERVQEAEAMLHERILPGVKETGGFVRGTWTRTLDDSTGRSLVVFDTEENARAALKAAQEMAPPPGAPITFDTADFDIVRIVTEL